MRYLKDDERKKFLSAAENYRTGLGALDSRPYVIAVIMLNSGLRVSEVVGEHYDYYTDEHGVRVSPRPSEKEAKKKKYDHKKNEVPPLSIENIDSIRNTLQIYHGKGKKDRIVPITPGGISVIQQYLSETGRNWGETGYLIKISVDRVQDWFKKISEDAKIRHVNPHMLRHTFSVMFLNNEGKIKILQKILGHSSLAVTEKYLDYVFEDVEHDYQKVMGKVDL